MSDNSYKERKQRNDFVDVSEEIDGVPLSDLLANVYKLFEKYGSDARIDISTTEDSDYCSIDLCFTRWETDAEMAARIAYTERQREAEAARLKQRELEETFRKQQEEREERLLLKKLKEKYGE